MCIWDIMYTLPISYGPACMYRVTLGEDHRKLYHVEGAVVTQLQVITYMHTHPEAGLVTHWRLYHVSQVKVWATRILTYYVREIWIAGILILQF